MAVVYRVIESTYRYLSQQKDGNFTNWTVHYLRERSWQTLGQSFWAFLTQYPSESRGAKATDINGCLFHPLPHHWAVQATMCKYNEEWARWPLSNYHAGERLPEAITLTLSCGKKSHTYYQWHLSTITSRLILNFRLKRNGKKGPNP